MKTRGKRQSGLGCFFFTSEKRFVIQLIVSSLSQTQLKRIKVSMISRSWGKLSPHTHVLWGGQKPPRRSRPASHAEGWACCYSDGVFFLAPPPNPISFEISHSHTNRTAFYTITNTNITILRNKVKSSCSSSHRASSWGAKSPCQTGQRMPQTG